MVLHIFGQCPEKEQLRDLIIAIARSPSYGRLGLTQALAKGFWFGFRSIVRNKPGIQTVVKM